MQTHRIVQLIGQYKPLLLRVPVGLAILSWLGLALLGVLEQYHYNQTGLTASFPALLKGTFFNTAIVSIYFYLRVKVRKGHLDFQTLLWRTFVTGLVCTFFSGLITLLLLFMEDALRHPLYMLLRNLLFHVEYALYLTVLMVCANVWKRLILHEKTRFTHYLWYSFEYTLGMTLILHFFRDHRIELYETLPFAVYVLWILLLATNLRWIPGFNFSQKLTGLSQLVVALCCLAYFMITLFSFNNEPTLRLDPLFFSPPLLVITGFVGLYGLSATLVMLFNLPTSSVFERKFKEISIFQQLSSAILEGESEEEVYKVLLSNAWASTQADVAWIEAKDGKIFLTEKIAKEGTSSLRALLYQEGFDDQQTFYYKAQFFAKRKSPYNSVLAFPLSDHYRKTGLLVVASRLQNAFDQHTVNTLQSFVAQAGVALENFRLVSQLVESERLQNEFQIARSVQNRLLPNVRIQDPRIDLFAYSESANEVGGDYYDLFRLDDRRYALIIADVSGKGISAAFYMAQMKGIFQCLVRMHLPPDQFLLHANAAISDCLDRSTFITATYYIVDTEDRKITFARAGHCPHIFLDSRTGTAYYPEYKGMGLGILRNDRYRQFVHLEEKSYHSGDMIVLYTDGIVEARAPHDQEEFGYDRLLTFTERHQRNEPSEFATRLFKTLREFSGRNGLEDDATLLILKF